MDRKASISVVAGVLSNARGEILIAKRKQHQDQGGLWEFPGGKREDGENSLDALKRELAEELAIKIGSAEPYLVQRHEYPAKIVHLEFFRVQSWRGEVRGAEGQEIRWAKIFELGNYEFPAANKVVVEKLTSGALQTATL